MFPVKTFRSSRVSPKFQVTIPKDVRESLGIDVGDLIVFVNDRNEVTLKRGEITIRD